MDDVDDRYIWQRRIAHGVRHQKGAVPFPECVRMGLDFNAAVDRKQKLQRHLLTNAVMLEICDFAKTVTKSEKYFLFELLDFNFDLGVDTDNDQRTYVYLTRVHSRIKQLKEQIKTKPGRWKETFSLPDPNHLSSDSLVSTVYCPKWNKMADSSLLTDGGGSSETSSNTCISKYRMKRGGGGGAFRFCSELGVSLVVVRPDQTPRRKLDRNMATGGVMLELLNFSRILCGTFVEIIYEMLRQNFGLEPDKLQLRFSLNKLMERKQMDRDGHQRELFQIHRKRKPPDTEQEVGSDQKRERLQDPDLSYTCPVECEMDDRTKSPDINQEEEPQVNGHFVSESPGGFAARRRKLWQRRAAHNLLESDSISATLGCSRRVGLDFNVSSGTNQKLDLRFLTNGVLQEVHRFANAMSRSTRHFLFDILSKNFLLPHQDAQHERDFIFSILIKEKFLQNHPDRHSAAFLMTPFQMQSDANMEASPQDDSTVTRQRCGDDVETHPYCRKLGLDLWSTEERAAGRKLDLTALTVGAIFEIVSFARELCGTACDIVTDILEHNFNVELRSGETEAAVWIRRWNLTNKTNTTQTGRGWEDMRVPLSGRGGHVGTPPRTNPDQLEEDPSRKYPLCREVGLTLNVRRGSGAKRKLDLRVLTRAVLVEVHRYVRLSSRHYVPALYGILEHNFDLTSQNHRKVEFAWAVASQVIAMATKSGKKRPAYRNAVFQLPFEAPPAVCKKEEEEEEKEEEEEEEDKEKKTEGDDVVFIRKLKPVDIMVEVE